jgi:hypothetical protein
MLTGTAGRASETRAGYTRMRRTIRIFFWREMKRVILAAGLALVGSVWSAQAGNESVIADRESASLVDDPSTISPGHSDGSATQNYGSLTGKPIFRLDPKYGDICVQTVFGKVNGAQLQVTW